MSGDHKSIIAAKRGDLVTLGEPEYDPYMTNDGPAIRVTTAERKQEIFTPSYLKRRQTEIKAELARIDMLLGIAADKGIE